MTNLQVNGTAINLFSTDPTRSSPTPAPDSDYSTIGDMVFRFEYSYLLKANATNTTTPNAQVSIVPYDRGAVPAHTTVNGFQDVAAIIVTLGILDSTSNAIVKDKTKLIGCFPDAVDGKNTLSVWQQVVLNQNFATNAGIPRPAAAAVRLYQRTFYLEPK